MAKPKRPRLLKTPRKPKNHTVNSMENYLTRKKNVEATNKKKLTDYNKEVVKYDGLRKKVANA